jgi:hypothetical protein
VQSLRDVHLELRSSHAGHHRAIEQGRLRRPVLRAVAGARRERENALAEADR